MTRLLCAAALLFAACGSAPPEWRLPAELDGGWKLSVLPPSPETAALAAKLAPKRSQMGGYEGPGKLLVSAFDVGEGVAFEQVQKWRARAGAIVFYHRGWFVAVESEGMDAAQLSKLAGALERTMP